MTPMRYVPTWLHCQLLRFAWYRRKCGLIEMSPEMAVITRECLRIAHQNLTFMEAVSNGKAWNGSLPTSGTIKIRQPVRYSFKDEPEVWGMGQH